MSELPRSEMHHPTRPSCRCFLRAYSALIHTSSITHTLPQGLGVRVAQLQCIQYNRSLPSPHTYEHSRNRWRASGVLRVRTSGAKTCPSELAVSTRHLQTYWRASVNPRRAQSALRHALRPLRPSSTEASNPESATLLVRTSARPSVRARSTGVAS